MPTGAKIHEDEQANHNTRHWIKARFTHCVVTGTIKLPEFPHEVDGVRGGARILLSHIKRATKAVSKGTIRTASHLHWKHSPQLQNPLPPVKLAISTPPHALYSPQFATNLQPILENLKRQSAKWSLVTREEEVGVDSHVSDVPEVVEKGGLESMQFVMM